MDSSAPYAQLQEWLLENYGAEKFRPGLERVGTFLCEELAAIRQLNPRIITVAGTNGKGETAFSLATLARQGGENFVVWTSPHLVRVTERMQNPQGEIPVDELHTLLQEVRTRAQREQVGLSYYEVLFCAFLRWGLKQQARVWIMEVGMGGRLDAVNLLDAQEVALTSISRDHQEFLGYRYQEILREKLAVARKGGLLVSALESKYLREQTESFCRLQGIRWEDLFESRALGDGSSFSERNRLLAQRIWGKSGPLNEVFPGRGEVWSCLGHEFQFYGSHNPDGMRKLVQLLRGGFYTSPQEKFHQIWAAFSQRSPKDLRAMAKMLAALASPRTQVCLTQFTHPKASALDEWWRQDEGSSLQSFHEWTELLTALPGSSTKILVTGSYYFVGAVQSHLLSLGGTRRQ